MNLPKMAVGRPVMTVMIFGAVIILGVISFSRLQIDLFPDIEYPSVSVVTHYHGAGPEEIEELITRPVEERVRGVENVDRVESVSQENQSSVTLSFEWGANIDAAMNDIRSSLAPLSDEFPDEATDPMVHRFDIDAFPILHLTLEGDLAEPDLRQLAEDRLEPRLEGGAGVASVDTHGGGHRQFQVEFDTHQMEALEVSAAEVQQALTRENQTLPAGQIEQFDRRPLVRLLLEARDAESLGEITVAHRHREDGTSEPVRVRDVAQVSDGIAEPQALVRINGENGMLAAVSNESGTNVVEVARELRREAQAIDEEFGSDVQIGVVGDYSNYIEAAIDNVQQAVLLGALLAILVLIGFLRSLRSVAIVAVSIPISIIGIFTLMDQASVSLNLISFGGIALGVGLLVDNALVIIENIYRKYEGGANPEESAVQGAMEVAGAIVASTITTLVVFVPVIFLTGLASVLYAEMAMVVSFALLFSLAAALSLIPMLASRWLPDREAGDRATMWPWIAPLERFYGLVASRALDHPWVIIGVVIIALVASWQWVDELDRELMPQSDQSEVSVVVHGMPENMSLERRRELVDSVERRIPEEVPEMKMLHGIIHQHVHLTLTLVPPGERERSSQEVADALTEVLGGTLPEGDVVAHPSGTMGILQFLHGGGERLEVKVRGYDQKTADHLTNKAREIMVDADGVTAAHATSDRRAGELRLEVDEDRLGDMPIEPSALGMQIQAYLQEGAITRVRGDGREFGVITRLPREQRRGLETFLDMPIVMPDHGHVELGEVAEMTPHPAPVTINREDQGRVVTISGFMEDGAELSAINEELRQRFLELDLPETFGLEVAGEDEERQEAFDTLILGILLALALVYIVMASQFESFLQPLYIMASIPVAGIGVVWLLWLTETSLNLQSLMGCVMLVGIVVNHAIVLVDYINLLRRQGELGVREAVEVGCRRRLRPILMTTVTTILALIPVALGLGEGADLQAPLAIAVIGGLLVSGAISLVLIPVIYNLVEGWRSETKAGESPDGEWSVS